VGRTGQGVEKLLARLLCRDLPAASGKELSAAS
jgi:hypothetical protein